MIFKSAITPGSGGYVEDFTGDGFIRYPVHTEFVPTDHFDIQLSSHLCRFLPSLLAGTFYSCLERTSCSHDLGWGALCPVHCPAALSKHLPAVHISCNHWAWSASHMDSPGELPLTQQ